MAISGPPKIFSKSLCLLKDGASITVTTGTPSADFAIDQNEETVWRSSGSSDASTEEIEVEFTSTEINRILLLGHNLKGYNIQYDVSGVWTDFTSVVGLDGSLASVVETAFADNTSYYEFAAVTTTKIRIQATTTQVADAEKYIGQIIVCTELGTFAGYPEVKKITHDRNARVVKTISGFYNVQKSLEVPSFDFEFSDYPSSSTYSADLDLVMTLQDREDPFLVWLCGGRRGSNYFKYTLRGWRLRDLYQMQVSRGLEVGYHKGIYTAPVSAKVRMEAVI